MTLDAAFQKFARHELCSRVALSNTVPIESVLRGILSTPNFAFERDIVKSGPQTVLTEFGAAELLEFYDAEHVAYEIWRCSAQLRIAGKGAPMLVTEGPLFICDNRSPELNELILSYDSRALQMQASLSSLPHSSSGVVFGSPTNDFSGCVLLPGLNTTRLPFEYGDMLKERFAFEFPADWTPAFQWGWIDFRAFYENHRPFAIPFHQRHMVQLITVLSTIAVLSRIVVKSWVERGPSAIWNSFETGYSPSFSHRQLEPTLQQAVPEEAKSIAGEEYVHGHEDIRRALEFWTLKSSDRELIDLCCPGPHAAILPIGNSRFSIDFAWTQQRVFHLMFGLRVSDNNFKGDSFEKEARNDPSPLTSKRLKTRGAGEKQVDAAYSEGDRLIIVECKAYGWSFGMERGSFDAVRHRSEYIGRSLQEVDEKAHWLARNPRGLNYDISDFRYIIPLVVSPFIEFIPSLDSRYWLAHSIPRILTVPELRARLADGTFGKIGWNLVLIQAD